MPVVVGRQGAVVARISAPAVAAIPPALIRGDASLGASRSLAAHRLFRWLPARMREQVLADRLDLSRAAPRLVVPGGLRALAKAIGEGEKHTAGLRLVLDWLQHAIVVGEDGTEYHGLLTWQIRPHAPRRQAEIVITPSTLLLLGGGRGKLVPVPHCLPPLAGDTSSWSSQASLQLLALEELRACASELVQHGGVLILRRRWQELADAAEVRLTLLDELLGSAWVADGRTGPAFLRRIDGDRWTLAPAYRAELATLEEGGRYDLDGQARGRKSAERRLARARRAAEKAT